MANAQLAPRVTAGTDALIARYRRVRATTLALTAPLAVEDQVVQVVPETSPTKWHLAHTTWFFERFVLGAHCPGYTPIDARYEHLFNSYYYTVGEMHARSQRGLLSRPTVAEVRDYRARVDDAVEGLLRTRGDEERVAFLVTLGLHHEQQHQELLLTDVKQVLFVNPLGPAYDALPAPPKARATSLAFVHRGGGEAAIGAAGDEFCFDNETPRHRVLLGEHALASRLVTNAEYREFIAAGGYTTPELWLADGWTTIRACGWNRPLCWSEDLVREFTLSGWREIDEVAPVCHVSFYEADAFARFAGARLPREEEWEVAATAEQVGGNLRDAGYLQPAPAAQGPSIAQLYGDVWEWCASAYGPYPGFRPLGGSLGEYNGKFMCNQLVVRGGSCITAAEHIRATYRSFFYPHDRWQFLGVRLAKDL
ncbi:MAG TPA: ergothioneine biosynthesis protein EgtB [Gammaproteobacteria bacterium]|nr:ergothioneine biosynthesis protein EgtB [Gammaproteobacteria bacterium]